MRATPRQSFRPRRCLAVAAMLLAAGQALGEQTFYVSTAGNDAWSGTLSAPNAAKTDGPLASLRAARDAVRKLKAAPGVAGAALGLHRGVCPEGAPAGHLGQGPEASPDDHETPRPHSGVVSPP